MPATLMPAPRQRFVDNVGLPLANGMVFTFAAGTSDKLAAFQDPDGLVPHENPIRLDIRGEATIYWLGNYKVDVRNALGIQLAGYPVDNFNALDVSAQASAGIAAAIAVFFANAGSSLIGFIQNFAGAVRRSVESKLRDELSVFDFMTEAQIADVKARTLQIDVTIPIKAAIEAANSSKIPLRFPRGWYKITDTLKQRAGTTWIGSSWFPSDWRVPTMATTKIKLVTTAPINAWEVDQTEKESGYVWGIGLKNMTFEGSDIDQSRGLFPKNMAGGVMENIGISRFWRGHEVEFGMMNEYNRVNSSKCLDSSFYINGNGVTTTQTYNRCVGRESPWAWILASSPNGNSIGTILNGCLIESTTVGGVSQHRSCSAEYNSIYCENAPDDRATTSGTLFSLFKNGTEVDQYRSVAVFNGGDLAGGNFGLFNGSCAIDVGSAKKVVINGTEIQRATFGIRWDSTTADGAISLNLPSFVQVTNLYTGPAKKLNGLFPDANMTMPYKTSLVADNMGERGEWTATLTPASGTVTLGAKTGSYIKLGDMIVLTGLITIDSVSAPTGLVKLKGLPYPCANGLKSQAAASINAWFLTGMTTESITATINYGTSEIEVSKYANGSPVSLGANLQAGAQLHISAIYFTA